MGGSGPVSGEPGILYHKCTLVHGGNTEYREDYFARMRNCRRRPQCKSYRLPGDDLRPLLTMRGRRRDNSRTLYSHFASSRTARGTHAWQGRYHPHHQHGAIPAAEERVLLIGARCAPRALLSGTGTPETRGGGVFPWPANATIEGCTIHANVANQTNNRHGTAMPAWVSHRHNYASYLLWRDFYFSGGGIHHEGPPCVLMTRGGQCGDEYRRRGGPNRKSVAASSSSP